MEVEHVLELAVRAAGTHDAGWHDRVLESIGDIAAMMNEHSLPWMVARSMVDDPVVFMAEYQGYRIESSSTRLIVSLIDVKTGEPEKDIRTDRTDEPLGAVMQRRLDRIPIGTRCRVFKVLESFQAGKETRKVRVLRYIEPMGKRDEEDRGPATAPAGPATRPQPVAPHPQATAPPEQPPASAASAGGVDLKYEEAFGRLTPREKIELAKAAMKMQILNVYQPQPDEIQTLTGMMEELVAAREP